MRQSFASLPDTPDILVDPCVSHQDPVSAICNPGTYVYQITGYSGSNNVYGPYATRFDIVCSDGYAATIGETGGYSSSSKTIINPQGYTSMLVGGGCITDHIQIGGTDFGNAKYPATLSSCSCAPGLSFVGFGTLQYQSTIPLFPPCLSSATSFVLKARTTLVAIASPALKVLSTYVINFFSIMMKIGTYSFPGSTTCNLQINTNVANGGLFALQVKSHSTYVNAFYGSPAVMGYGSIFDTNQQLKYLAATMQIYHPTSGLCLDDGGKETLGTSSYSTVLSFKPCDSSSINQQFIFTTGNKIYNPNWPNNQVCLNGNGNKHNAFQELILWFCSPSDSNEIFNVVLICPPGTAIRYDYCLLDSF